MSEKGNTGRWERQFVSRWVTGEMTEEEKCKLLELRAQVYTTDLEREAPASSFVHAVSRRLLARGGNRR